MKFDWQHVAILGIGAALMGALIITGHGSTVTAILGTGGLGTIVAYAGCAVPFGASPRTNPCGNQTTPGFQLAPPSAIASARRVGYVPLPVC